MKTTITKFLSFIGTRLAFSVLTFLCACVLFVVGMPLWAMSPLFKSESCIAASDVLSLSNDLQMVRIYAPAITAQVVELHIVRNRAVVDDPGCAMRSDDLAVASSLTDHPVAITQDTSCEIPTTRGIVNDYLFHQAILERSARMFVYATWHNFDFIKSKPMYQTLKQKLFAAALQNQGLVNILGGGSPLVLRWFDTQLQQSANAGGPSIVVRQITDPQTYVTTGRLPASFAVMRFECYGAQADAGSNVPPDSVSTDLLVQALLNFLDTFNGDGVTGRPQSPNQVLSDREDGIPQTQPLVIRRVVDVRIYWNGDV